MYSNMKNTVVILLSILSTNCYASITFNQFIEFAKDSLTYLSLSDKEKNRLEKDEFGAYLGQMGLSQGYLQGVIEHQSLKDIISNKKLYCIPKNMSYTEITYLIIGNNKLVNKKLLEMEAVVGIEVILTNKFPCTLDTKGK